MNIYISLYNWADNTEIDLYFYRIIIKMSYVNGLELIYTILGIQNWHVSGTFVMMQYYRPLLNHSVSKHNYEILFLIRFCIIKKQIIRAHTSSLHHNCHIHNYNYSTSIYHRYVAACRRKLFPWETPLHIDSCAGELSACCQIIYAIPKQFSCRFDCYLV